MATAHKYVPPDYRLTLREAREVDTVRLAMLFNLDPDVIEGWSLEKVNRVLAVLEADNNISKLKWTHP